MTVRIVDSIFPTLELGYGRYEQARRLALAVYAYDPW
jgi:hypothetical protein